MHIVCGRCHDKIVANEGRRRQWTWLLAGFTVLFSIAAALMLSGVLSFSF